MSQDLNNLLKELAKQDQFSVSKYFANLSDAGIELLIRHSDKIPEEFEQAFLGFIRRRGVSDWQIKWVQDNFKSLEEFTIYRLMDRIRASACPFCKKESYLQAERTYQVISYFINSKVKVNSYFGCVECLKKERFAAYGLNMSFGWWSIKGLILNPLTYYLMIRRSNNDKRSEAYMREWIIALKTAVLSMDSQEEFNGLLEVHNKSQKENKFRRVYINTLHDIFR